MEVVKRAPHGSNIKQLAVEEPCHNHALIAGVCHHPQQHNHLIAQEIQKLSSSTTLRRVRATLAKNKCRSANQGLEIEHDPT